MSQRLGGKVAIVTGSAAGIGEATCERFTAEGATVVIVDWNGDRARETVDRLEFDHGIETLAVETDVGYEAAVRRMVDRCEERFGCVDVLVNNRAFE